MHKSHILTIGFCSNKGCSVGSHTKLKLPNSQVCANLCFKNNSSFHNLNLNKNQNTNKKSVSFHGFFFYLNTSQYLLFIRSGANLTLFKWRSLVANLVILGHFGINNLLVALLGIGINLHINFVGGLVYLLVC